MLPAIRPAIFVPRYTPSPHTVSVSGGDLRARPSPTCTSFLCKEARACLGMGAELHAERSPVGTIWEPGQWAVLKCSCWYCSLHLEGKQKAALRIFCTSFPKCWQDCYYHPHYYHMRLYLTKGNHILAKADMIPVSPILNNIGSVQNPDAEIHWSLSHNWFTCKWLWGLQTQTQHTNLL